MRLEKAYQEFGSDFETKLWKSIECMYGGEMHEEDDDPLVQGLIRLVVHAVSRSMSMGEIKVLCSLVGFSVRDTDTTLRVMQECWTDLSEMVHTHQQQGSRQDGGFESVQWRVQVETGSRFVHNTKNLNCLLGITTTCSSGEEKELWIDCDLSNLVHLENSLSQAVLESLRGPNTRFLRSL